MTSQLTLYNDALRHLGAGKLASLSETGERRSALDDIYTNEVAFCLTQGFPNFGMRSVSMTESATITPEFGYTYAFEKPSDWLRTYRLADNENFDPQLECWNDEAQVWYASVTPLFAKYVSNSASYGLNLSAWTPAFVSYVGWRLAFIAAPSIPAVGTDRIEWLDKQQIKAKNKAFGLDATDEPPQRNPMGSWARSRGGGRSRDPRSQTLGY